MNRKRTVSGTTRYVATILFCLLLAAGFVSSAGAAPFNLHAANSATSDAIESDPEFDLDRDGLLNRDDYDNDGDGIPDALSSDSGARPPGGGFSGANCRLFHFLSTFSTR